MPEIRLIDANAAADKIMHDVEDHAEEIGIGAVAIMIAFARALRDETDFPTIEAEPVRKPEMSEADRKKCEEWCKDCEHIEMCKWYPFGGCDFRLLPKPEQSTIEPKVRHGRWKVWTTSKFTGRYKDYDEPDFKDYVYYTCSECYRKSAIQELYCPHCGARMDGGADNG